MAFVFLVLALIAGLLGFDIVAGLSIEIARILFFVFLGLFVLALIANVARGSARPTDVV